MNSPDPIRQASDRIRLWREKPQVFVREVFGATPDPWQDEALEAFPTTPRLALLACKGPGKTAVEAWIAWNFLLTRPHPKIAATAISGDNLRDNLWAEMAKWQIKSPLLRDTFQWTKERIFAKEAPETWWMSARTFRRDADPAQQADTLAGLHADYVMAMLDESGGMTDAVMATAEAILSSCIEGHIVQAGNPTHLEGPLYSAATKERHLWKVISITGDPDDPKRSSRVSIQWANEQIQKYGRDNPWVLVNVFGRFPPSSLNSLIGPDEVNRMLGAHIRENEYEFASKVIGIDVADEGDDRSVIFPRQGNASFTPIILRNTTPEDGAGRALRLWNEFGADGVFIDNSGGWASGWRAVMRTVGREPWAVGFAEKPNDPTYYNKRAEMWFAMCQAIKDGLVLPNLPELVGELTVPTYTFKGDKFLLEPKDQIKTRLGRSPDIADALALTFAHPVQPRLNRGLQGLVHQSFAKTDYSPYDI